LRAVLDAAILVRAHRPGTGLGRVLLDELLKPGNEVITSPELLAELGETLRDPRVARHFGLSGEDISEYLDFLEDSTFMADLDSALRPPIRDPKDVHVVQAAICANADYLCTLDKHFFEEPILAFCADRGVTVISDIDLLKKLRQ
jgi:putative PIN family toxin of toxin-antitoxin system